MIRARTEEDALIQAAEGFLSKLLLGGGSLRGRRPAVLDAAGVLDHGTPEARLGLALEQMTHSRSCCCHAFHLAALLVLFLPSLGCTALRAPLTAPEKGGPAWTEVTSPNFVLTTDAGPEKARAMAADFEEMHAALAFVMRRPPGALSARLEVVAFDRQEDFFEISGRRPGVGAYFTSHPPGDLEPQPVAVMPREDMADDTKLTFQHELAHRFLHERFASLPPWLDEGLAQYFSSLRIDAGHAVLGAPIDRDFSDRPFFWTSWQGNSQQTQMPRYKAPKVSELVHADRDRFYGSAKQEDVPDEERDQSDVFYGAAWKLVHLFMNGPIPGHYARFSTFLAAVQRGARASDTFTETFGAGLPELETAFHAYLLEARLSVRTLALPPAPPASASADRIHTRKKLARSRVTAQAPGMPLVMRAGVSLASGSAPRGSSRANSTASP